MKSVLYRPTGRLIAAGLAAGLTAAATLAKAEKEIHPCCIIRNNEVYAPEFLENRHLQGRSIFVNGDVASGVDQRVNAVGDTADQATGFQISMDTLTYIIKDVSRQKFYIEPVGDHLPIRIGEGAFSRALLTNRSYLVGDDPEAGFIRTGASDSRLSMMDTAVDGVTTYIANWMKGIAYTIFDVEEAMRANSYDLIAEKHISRKTNWDLLVQKIAMLGSATDSRMPGLLTNTNINTITGGFLTQYISSMNAGQLQAFVTGLITAYFANTNSTALPNTFVIPYQDYLAMPVQTPGTQGNYPVPMITYLEEAFTKAVKMKESSFRIIPSAYCDAANNPAGLHYYMLYRNDPRSLRMNIPVDYTVTQPGTINNAQFQDVGYGQITGVTMLRNLETLRFTF